MAERPEDLNLPNSVVMRLIKEALPDGVLVSKEARGAIARAASVFVLYATSTANGLAQANKKKTLLGQDVIDAMTELEFDQFVDPLNDTLAAFKKSMQDKRTQKEAKAKAKKSADAAVATTTIEGDTGNKDSDESAATPSKDKDTAPDSSPVKDDIPATATTSSDNEPPSSEADKEVDVTPMES